MEYEATLTHTDAICKELKKILEATSSTIQARTSANLVNRNESLSSPSVAPSSQPAPLDQKSSVQEDVSTLEETVKILVSENRSLREKLEKVTEQLQSQKREQNSRSDYDFNPDSTYKRQSPFIPKSDQLRASASVHNHSFHAENASLWREAADETKDTLYELESIQQDLSVLKETTLMSMAQLNISSPKAHTSRQQRTTIIESPNSHRSASPKRTLQSYPQIELLERENAFLSSSLQDEKYRAQKLATELESSKQEYYNSMLLEQQAAKEMVQYEKRKNEEHQRTIQMMSIQLSEKQKELELTKMLLQVTEERLAAQLQFDDQNG